MAANLCALHFYNVCVPAHTQEMCLVEGTSNEMSTESYRVYRASDFFENAREYSNNSMGYLTRMHWKLFDRLCITLHTI